MYLDIIAWLWKLIVHLQHAARQVFEEPGVVHDIAHADALLRVLYQDLGQQVSQLIRYLSPLWNLILHPQDSLQHHSRVLYNERPGSSQQSLK